MSLKRKPGAALGDDASKKPRVVVGLDPYKRDHGLLQPLFDLLRELFSPAPTELLDLLLSYTEQPSPNGPAIGGRQGVYNYSMSADRRQLSMYQDLKLLYNVAYNTDTNKSVIEFPEAKLRGYCPHPLGGSVHVVNGPQSDASHLEMAVGYPGVRGSPFTVDGYVIDLTPTSASFGGSWLTKNSAWTHQVTLSTQVKRQVALCITSNMTNAIGSPLLRITYEHQYKRVIEVGEHKFIAQFVTRFDRPQKGWVVFHEGKFLQPGSVYASLGIDAFGVDSQFFYSLFRLSNSIPRAIALVRERACTWKLLRPDTLAACVHDLVTHL